MNDKQIITDKQIVIEETKQAEPLSFELNVVKLKSKGFKNEVLSKSLGITEEKIKEIMNMIDVQDYRQQVAETINLYTDIQTDLTIFIQEENKQGKDKDKTAILNALKHKMELQDKKIQILKEFDKKEEIENPKDGKPKQTKLF